MPKYLADRINIYIFMLYYKYSNDCAHSADRSCVSHVYLVPDELKSVVRDAVERPA